MADENSDDLLAKMGDLINDTTNKFKDEVAAIRRETEDRLARIESNTTDQTEEHKLTLKGILDWITSEEDRRKKEEEDRKKTPAKPTLVSPPQDLDIAQPTPQPPQEEAPPPVTATTSPRKKRVWTDWI